MIIIIILWVFWFGTIIFLLYILCASKWNQNGHSALERGGRCSSYLRVEGFTPFLLPVIFGPGAILSCVVSSLFFLYLHFPPISSRRVCLSRCIIYALMLQLTGLNSHLVFSWFSVMFGAKCGPARLSLLFPSSLSAKFFFSSNFSGLFERVCLSGLYSGWASCLFACCYLVHLLSSCCNCCFRAMIACFF